MQRIDTTIKKPGLYAPTAKGGFTDSLEARLADVVNQNFEEFDNFKKGFLDMDDFGTLLKKNTGRFFSEKEVKDLLTIADKNKDKVIDKNELSAFYKMLMKECKILNDKWSSFALTNNLIPLKRRVVGSKSVYKQSTENYFR